MDPLKEFFRNTRLRIVIEDSTIVIAYRVGTEWGFFDGTRSQRIYRKFSAERV